MGNKSGKRNFQDDTAVPSSPGPKLKVHKKTHTQSRSHPQLPSLAQIEKEELAHREGDGEYHAQVSGRADTLQQDEVEIEIEVEVDMQSQPIPKKKRSKKKRDRDRRPNTSRNAKTNNTGRVGARPASHSTGSGIYVPPPPEDNANNAYLIQQSTPETKNLNVNMATVPNHHAVFNPAVHENLEPETPPAPIIEQPQQQYYAPRHRQVNFQPSQSQQLPQNQRRHMSQHKANYNKQLPRAVTHHGSLHQQHNPQPLQVRRVQTQEFGNQQTLQQQQNHQKPQIRPYNNNPLNVPKNKYNQKRLSSPVIRPGKGRGKSKPLPKKPRAEIKPLPAMGVQASDTIKAANRVVPALQAASNIQVNNKEAVVMDMTMQQISGLQGLKTDLRGVGSNDQSKTLREILAEKEARSRQLQARSSFSPQPPQTKWNKSYSYNDTRGGPPIGSSSQSQPPIERHDSLRARHEAPQGPQGPQLHPPHHQSLSQRPRDQRKNTPLQVSYQQGGPHHAPQYQANRQQPRQPQQPQRQHHQQHPQHQQHQQHPQRPQNPHQNPHQSRQPRQQAPAQHVPHGLHGQSMQPPQSQPPQGQRQNDLSPRKKKKKKSSKQKPQSSKSKQKSKQNHLPPQNHVPPQQFSLKRSLSNDPMSRNRAFSDRNASPRFNRYPSHETKHRAMPDDSFAVGKPMHAGPVAQKMPQQRDPLALRQPDQNPWHRQAKSTGNWQNERPLKERGRQQTTPNPNQNPNPNPNFNQNHGQALPQQKYNHNFDKKKYNKKAKRKKRSARHRMKQRQQQQQQQGYNAPPPQYNMPAKDPDGYESDESVFVHQWEVARRRHSIGSSTTGMSTHDITALFNKPNKPQTEEELVLTLELTEKQFYKKYWIEEKIGQGSFARVRKIKRKKDQKVFALKMIKKAGKSKEDLDALQREIGILAKINHTNVVTLTNWCDTKTRIYMVLEFCDGGDVFERILKEKTFSEKEAVRVVQQVAQGLKHSHLAGIVHRDLKPDNLMYLDKGYNSPVIIIDYGLAGDCSHGPLTTPCGTAHYVAPEVLSGESYGTKADMWSLGVIIYMLLCGFPPFFDANGNQKRLYSLIKDGRYRFPSPYWDYISDTAKDLIKHLLQTDVGLRYDADATLKHKWVAGHEAGGIDLGQLYMEQMEHFSSSRRFVDVKLHQKAGVRPNYPPEQHPAKASNPKNNRNFQYFARKQHAFQLN